VESDPPKAAHSAELLSEFDYNEIQLELIADMHRWSPQGACRQPGIDRTVFLYDRTRDKKQNQLMEARAKAICRACPVLDDCLFHALELPEVAGTWGGMTDLERGRLQGKGRKW
jgi:WhiB family redox-sensing transcriptional regulator